MFLSLKNNNSELNRNFFNGEKNFYLCIAAILFFFVITQEFPNIEQIYNSGFSDSISYLEIAKCATLTNCQEIQFAEGVTSFHIQRWFPNVLAGFISTNFAISIEKSYVFLQFISLFIVVISTINSNFKNSTK